MRTVRDLCLGTVKLGNPEYGFSSSGAREKFDPLHFLQEAGKLGISRFDTSPRYGNSEEVLGMYLKDCTRKPWVSSKIDNLKPNAKETPKMMIESVERSLTRLHLDSLDLCYLHQNDLAIITDSYVQEGFVQLKERQLIKETGASLYSIEECSAALAFGIYDMIQVPISVFDLKFYDYLVKNSEKRIKIAGRSLLLQGILVNREDILLKIRQGEQVLEYLKMLDELAQEAGCSTLELGLAFAFSLSGVDHFLLGTTAIDNLKLNIKCLRLNLPDLIRTRIAELARPERDWTNPRNWTN